MVEIIRSSSISVSFTGGEVGCTMYTSFPRTFSFTITFTSPSAKWLTVILLRDMPRWLAMSSARGLLALPVKSFSPVDISATSQDQQQED